MKEEKKALEEELKTRVEAAERTMDAQKDGELQELRRGKVEALQVLQVRLSFVVCLSNLCLVYVYMLAIYTNLCMCRICICTHVCISISDCMCV